MTNNYFYKNTKNKTDGFYPECKECSIKKTQINRAENFEYRKQYDQKRYKSNPQKFKDNDKKVQKAKPEYYRNKNIKWRKEHPDKMKEYREKRLKHKKHNITKSEWIACKNYFDNKCAYCELPIEKHLILRNYKWQQYDLHKEHAIDDGKNDLRNCIPSCQSCNSSKNNQTLNQFYNPNNPNYTYERYHKIYMWIRYDYKKYIEKKKPKRKYTRKSK